MSDRPGTVVGRTVGQFGGAGIHHIAIAVDDVVATVRQLRARGMPMLAIPANYYDDLGAKYGIEQATLAARSELGVKLERSGEGEILHAYSTPFDNRFFFELIERRNGYEGYGAGNAPFRLAALAHWASQHGSALPGHQTPINQQYSHDPLS